MKIEITNQQRIKRINRKRINYILRRITALLGLSSQKITFVFCDNRFIQKLNKKYFKKDIPTDVIAFPLAANPQEQYLGEVIISVEQAQRVGKELGLRWQDEILLYLIHGILHLIGYDDRTRHNRQRMQRKEKRILSALLETGATL